MWSPHASSLVAAPATPHCCACASGVVAHEAKVSRSAGPRARRRLTALAQSRRARASPWPQRLSPRSSSWAARPAIPRTVGGFGSSPEGAPCSLRWLPSPPFVCARNSGGSSGEVSLRSVTLLRLPLIVHGPQSYCVCPQLVEIQRFRVSGQALAQSLRTSHFPLGFTHDRELRREQLDDVLQLFVRRHIVAAVHRCWPMGSSMVVMFAAPSRWMK